MLRGEEVPELTGHPIDELQRLSGAEDWVDVTTGWQGDDAIPRD